MKIKVQKQSIKVFKIFKRLIKKQIIMGQKVHPLGFRVGITKKHQSQWFARFNKNKYAQSVLEDNMLRKTLTSLFPQLLNPVLKKAQKSVANSSSFARDESLTIPKITQIKIERGLIPYEIGIQIHAENCDLIKSSIDNLKVNRDLLCNLQKTRRYLQHLRLKLNDLGESSGLNKKEALSEPALQGNKDVVKTDSRFRNRLRTRNSEKQQIRGFSMQGSAKRLIMKRLKKRQSIRRRYQQLVFKGLFLTKKGNKVIQTLSFPNLQKSKKATSSGTGGVSSRFSPSNPLLENKKRRSVNQVNTNESASIFKLRIKKKFVSLFVTKVNNQFLQALKTALHNCSADLNNGSKKTLGWSSKWDFKKCQKQLSFKTVSQLTKLVSVLEKKSLSKMESLRKDFITFGSITKVDALNYYQILLFVKQLKELISQIKRKQKLQVTLLAFPKAGEKLNKASLDVNINGKPSTKENFGMVQKLQSKININEVKMSVLSQKLDNIDNECRKIKFIEYLKQLVKQHRADNIYLYLSTIADARKDLRKLQQFTKKHSAFLFGFSLSQKASNVSGDSITSSSKIAGTISRSVQNALKASFDSGTSEAKAENATLFGLEKSLPNIFLEQIEKQRKMYQDNAQLIPKIAIKFYSVNADALKAKASFVADSVVDALEKRKAFRKVIKDAKEELMRMSGVKGVKIEVSGRLNGAEIARSEWVRAGRVPLQTLRANLDYSYKTANTIYGIIGVKVWIFKGYTKLI
jgi:ribosomal protein S3